MKDKASAIAHIAKELRLDELLVFFTKDRKAQICIRRGSRYVSFDLSQTLLEDCRRPTNLILDALYDGAKRLTDYEKLKDFIVAPEMPWSPYP